MRKVILGAASALALASPATAADLPAAAARMLKLGQRRNPGREAFKIDAGDSDEPNAMVDDTCRVELMLQGFRKAEQHIAAIHLPAGELGCPSGDPGGFSRAI
jgi:hypothetical protein